MPAKLLEIRDAVVVAINGQTFNPDFTAAATIVPIYELTALKTLQVPVIGLGATEEMVGRNLTQDDYNIQVGFEQQAEPRDKQTIDALVGLVQAVAKYLRFMPMSGAAWIKTEYNAPYDAKTLDTKNVFISVLTLTYRIHS